jgi:hypothetical protein
MHRANGKGSQIRMCLGKLSLQCVCELAVDGGPERRATGLNSLDV